MPTEDGGGRLPFEHPLGARPIDPHTFEFRVWPSMRIGSPSGLSAEITLGDAGLGVFEGRHLGAHGDEYLLVLDGTPHGRTLLAAPRGRKGGGVRGPSGLVDPGRHAWGDVGWAGPDTTELILYELHVGAFTAEGTFDAAAARLPDLARMGFTAVELMPVATFPGSRNWGYDGLYTDLFAPQASYGGPEGLRRLVDAAHAVGLAVVLDVVYNHFGPGETDRRCYSAPYFSVRSTTPWGGAVNYDDRRCGAVREWAVQNACMWIEEYHLDGLRLDAVQAIVDTGPRPVLAELTARARAVAGDRPVILHAESDTNDPALVRAADRHGIGFDGVWADDFHHALHALLTGDRTGYYADYGRVRDLADAYRTPFGLRRALLAVSREAPRRPGRGPAPDGLRRLCPEPRPGRQPRARVTACRRGCAARQRSVCLCCRALDADGLKGEDAWRDPAVPGSDAHGTAGAVAPRSPRRPTVWIAPGRRPRSVVRHPPACSTTRARRRGSP